mgnify:CR=1 FL=1
MNSLCVWSQTTITITQGSIYIKPFLLERSLFSIGIKSKVAKGNLQSRPMLQAMLWNSVERPQPSFIGKDNDKNPHKVLD